MLTNEKLENGIHDISNERYHNSQGISRSALWLFKQSPKHYWHKYLNPNKEPEKFNANYQMGEMVHTLILEPSKFYKKYYVMEKVNRTTKAGKEAYQKALTEANDREIINGQEYLIANEIAKSVYNTDIAKNLFDGAKIEKSIYFTHEPTGLQCKVRPDAWLGSLVTDLKTVKDGSYKGFQRSAYNYGYFLQASMMKVAFESIEENFDKFLFYCAEKIEPYACSYYIVDDEALEYGIKQFNKLMENFARCYENNQWSSYEPQILTLPAYANYED